MATKTARKTAKAAKSVEKFPELRRTFNSLQKKKEAILKKSAPARERREALLKRIQPLEAELREVNAEIAKIERPKLGQIDNQISGIARAMGGRSMSDVDTPPAEPPAPKE